MRIWEEDEAPYVFAGAALNEFGDERRAIDPALPLFVLESARRLRDSLRTWL
ncbi:MAG: hypothetical protein ACREB5_01770 [Sphingomonadaceae bacterium]